MVDSNARLLIVVDHVKLDEDDRRMLHALQLDGRASFARIATVLGLSERTVSRRYHRLRSQLALRVFGITGHDQRAQEDWFLRITATPASVDAVARILAARSDTAWIASLAGSGGLSCILRVPTATGEGSAALEQFRRGTAGGTVTAQRLLMPVAGVGGWPGRLQALTATEQEALKPSAMGQGTSASLSPDDERLLRLLAADGRTSVARLASASSIPESTVRRRIVELTARGVLMFEVEVDPKLYGRYVDVICWLDVQPAALRTVTAALGSHTQVAFAATTTGTSNIVALVEVTTTNELHDYLSDRIGTLPGVHRVHTEIVSRWIKRAGPPLLPPS
ncbi:Lrp/AsnC family transcriptional regulator [Nocardia sp. NPDC055029]